MKSLEIENQRQQKLAAVLHGTLGEALVITCHGMLSAKDGEKHLRLCDLLEKRGLPALRFDFAGRGDSEGELLDMSYSAQMEDLAAIIDWAAAEGVKRIGLFGSSMGGAVALLAAARDERVVAVATLAAVGHPEMIDERYPEAARSWHQRGFVETPAGKIGRGYYDDALQHDVLAAVRILRAPLYVVHGEEDEVVPVSDAHDIASTARAAQLELVPGADHRFSNPQHLRPALQGIADFLARSLQ